jgi:hypothetical protein
LTAQLDAPVDREVLLACRAASAGLAPLEVRICPDVDFISLVVEIGTVIDEGKVGNDEIGSAPFSAARRRIEIFHVGDRISIIAGRLSVVRPEAMVTEGMEELRHLA